MLYKLKTYCNSIISLTNEELSLIDEYFELKTIKKK